MQKEFFTLLLVICCNFAYSQTFSIAQIDSLVSVIDTSAYKQKTIEGTLTTKPGKDKGSLAETYYMDTLSEGLVKVEVAQALYGKNKHLTNVELTTYYYHSHKLVFVKASRFDTFRYPSFRKSLSSGTYYYDGDKIILSKETGYKQGGIVYISKAKTYRDILSIKVFPSN